jgi:hypothetical protein
MRLAIERHLREFDRLSDTPSRAMAIRSSSELPSLVPGPNRPDNLSKAQT